MIARLTALTGFAPLIFVPGRAMDSGGYNSGGVGYDAAGDYNASPGSVPYRMLHHCRS